MWLPIRCANMLWLMPGHMPICQFGNPMCTYAANLYSQRHLMLDPLSSTPCSCISRLDVALLLENPRGYLCDLLLTRSYNGGTQPARRQYSTHILSRPESSLFLHPWASSASPSRRYWLARHPHPGRQLRTRPSTSRQVFQSCLL